MTFEEHLGKQLKDPEFAAYYLEAQAESAQELLKAGIITALDVGSSSSVTEWSNE